MSITDWSDDEVQRGATREEAVAEVLHLRGELRGVKFEVSQEMSAATANLANLTAMVRARDSTSRPGPFRRYEGRTRHNRRPYLLSADCCCSRRARRPSVRAEAWNEAIEEAAMKVDSFDEWAHCDENHRPEVVVLAAEIRLLAKKAGEP